MVGTIILVAIVFGAIAGIAAAYDWHPLAVGGFAALFLAAAVTGEAIQQCPGGGNLQDACNLGTALVHASTATHGFTAAITAIVSFAIAAWATEKLKQ
jgi:hypothetical protein